MGVLRYHKGVVGVFYVAHVHRRIPVDERVDILRAEQEGCDHLAGVELLAASVDDSVLYQLQQAVGEHLRVQPEVPVARKLGRQGVRERTYAHLYAVAVLHERGAVLSDQHLGGRWFGEIGRHERGVVAHQVVELVEVQQVAVCERHIGVDDSDYKLRGFHGRYRAVHRGSEADIPVLVGKGDVDQRGPELDAAVAVELLALSEMHGEIVGVAPVDILPDVRAHEEALLEEDSFVGGVAVGSRSFGMEMMEMQVGHIPCVGAAAECADQAMRHAGDAAEVDMAVRRNVAHGLVGGDMLRSFHRY